MGALLIETTNSWRIRSNPSNYLTNISPIIWKLTLCSFCFSSFKLIYFPCTTLVSTLLNCTSNEFLITSRKLQSTLQQGTRAFNYHILILLYHCFWTRKNSPLDNVNVVHIVKRRVRTWVIIIVLPSQRKLLKQIFC